MCTTKMKCEYEAQASNNCVMCLSIPYADSTSIGYNNQKGKKYCRNIYQLVLCFDVCRSGFFLSLHHLVHVCSLTRSFVSLYSRCLVVLTIWQAMKINLQCVKSYTYYRPCDVCTQFSNIVDDLLSRCATHSYGNKAFFRTRPSDPTLCR